MILRLKGVEKYASYVYVGLLGRECSFRREKGFAAEVRKRNREYETVGYNPWLSE